MRSEIIKIVWARINKKIPDLQYDDRLDVFHDTLDAFLGEVQQGQFRGKYGEQSITANLISIADKKCADFIRWLKEEKGHRTWEKTGKEPYDTDPDSPNEKDPWLENFSYSSPDTEYIPEKKYETKVQDEIIARETKYPDILRLRREGCTIKEVANILDLPYERVKKRIQREEKRLSKITSSLGWDSDSKQDLDKSLNLMTSAPCAYPDKITKILGLDDFKELGYVLPLGKRKVKKHEGLYRGHRRLTNKMRAVQHAQYRDERICVKCNKAFRKEDTIIDNMLTYCKKCHENFK